MKLNNALRIAALLAALFIAYPSVIQAATLDELLADSELTPERFARHFADFEFQLREQVQPPEAFLASRKGDCDDYATLAANLLSKKGYTPKLVVIYMPKDIHVVCYIAETKSYLDFNSRKSAQPMIPSSGSLIEIADKVAASFQSNWHCVSEFTYTNGVRRVVEVDFPRAKPATPAAPLELKPPNNQIAAAGN